MFERLILPVIDEEGVIRIKEFLVYKGWLRWHLFLHFRSYDKFIFKHTSKEIQKIYDTADFRNKIIKERWL